MRVTVLAPAKVNLFLGVGERRDDGYHEVATVLQTLALADEITLEISDTPRLTSDTDLGIAPEDNLAMRAVAALAEAVGRDADLSIELRKSIPAGAGLGGGSSDAAAALMGAAHLWCQSQGDPLIAEVAASIGADVPFFLEGGAALYRNRGDVLDRRLESARASVLLVKPDASVPTAEAYAAFDADPRPAGSPAGVIGALEMRDARALGLALRNNLAPAAESLVGEVGVALAWCRDQAGVLGAEVSGSGSAVFALFAEDDLAEHAARVAKASFGWWTTATATSAHGARLVEGGW
ncbi:MAG: 4-(cytidine 5'-diphospho)-2-C-methyl-D-erythritol kinase [Coriobacteriales bacterium]|nr:4-(cytidine 5'-diphospho)-2-C-methyl-D-erythritol kinase [Coriobacteriales bacterium]